MHFTRILITVLLLGAITSPIHAEPNCIPTVRIRTSHYPGVGSIPPNNNLVLPTGKSVEPEGQKMLLTGQLLDSKCRPVPEAVVELWQLDPYGKWNVASKAEQATPYPSFAGAGRAVTNGEGEFTFITSFPGVIVRPVRKGEYTTSAPQLNIRVNPPYAPDFTTVLFFDNDQRNASDPVFKRLKPEQRQTILVNLTPDANNNLTGVVQLVLPGNARYRTY